MQRQDIRLTDNKAKCSVLFCFLLYFFHQQEESDGRGIEHVWGRGKLHLVERSEGRRPHGRPRRGGEDNIKMRLQEVEWGGMEWIDLA